MHSPILIALMGMISFAALAASAPAVSYDSLAALCDPTTVFVTVGSLSTVTVYQPPETIIVTLPCTSPLSPTTTYTLHSTSTATLYPLDTAYLTASARISDPENAATTQAPKYVATVTETTVLLITDVQLTPYPSGGSLTYSETAAANGLLTFVVQNGTTYWLNGQTPAPSKSYVVQTSVVTVEPIPASHSPPEETSTIHLTHYSTSSFTITETLPSSSAAKGAPSHTPKPTTQPTSTPCSTSTLSTYIRAGSSFSAVGTGVWNRSSATMRSGLQTGAFGVPTTLSLMPIDPSQPVSLATTYSALSLSTLAAQSGFDAYGISTPALSTSANAGVYTTLAVPPYGNVTASSSKHSVSSTAAGSGSKPTGYSIILSSAVSTSKTIKPSSPSGYPTGTSANMTSSYSAFNSTTITPTYPTSTSKNSTSVSSTVSPTSSNCGEYGDFSLTFDDIPPLSVSDPNPDDVQPEPVFNPYHQFDFSDGWVVVPPPAGKYLPSSKPLFTEFIPNFNINGTDPLAGPNTLEYGYSGDIGNGDHGLTGCFGFNMYGASFGCDSNGPPCIFSFTGFRLNKATGNTTAVTSQRISIDACPTLRNCTLTPVTLDNTFKDLDSVRINVTVASAPKIWWMDDIRLGWFDNSCKTGLCRINTPIH